MIGIDNQDVSLQPMISCKNTIFSHVHLMTRCKMTNLLVEQIMLYRKKVFCALHSTLPRLQKMFYKCEIMMDWNLNRVLYLQLIYTESRRACTKFKSRKIIIFAVRIFGNVIRST